MESLRDREVACSASDRQGPIFRILCLEGSVISVISRSSGGSPVPFLPICAQMCLKPFSFLLDTIAKNSMKKYFFTELHKVTGNTQTTSNKLRRYRQIKHGYRLETYLKNNLKPSLMKPRTRNKRIKFLNGWVIGPIPIPAEERFCCHGLSKVVDPLVVD